MSGTDPFDDLDNWQLPPMGEARIGTTPAKIQKRRKKFIMVPLGWVEKLEGCSGHTYHVALHLLYLHWTSHGKPIQVANGMLRYDGVSRRSKWRALTQLEQRGLIIIERRNRRSPIIRLKHEPNLAHPHEPNLAHDFCHHEPDLAQVYLFFLYLSWFFFK